MNIAVLGSTFVDYKGCVESCYDPVGRNQGKIKVVHGGVARNVAENLACLGIDTHFVTILNDDDISSSIAKRLVKKGVKLDLAEILSSNAIGIWLAILDSQGNLLSSISQLPNLSLLENLIVKNIHKITQHVNHIAMDIDLTPKIAEVVSNAVKGKKIKLYALPGNLTVIKKQPTLFQHMECFICNESEASKLMEQPFPGSDIPKAQELLAYFCNFFKISQAVITLGEYGSVFRTKQGDLGFQSIYPTKVADSTGAGDAFFSATITALIHGYTLPKAANCGARLASLIISSHENTCYGFSDKCLADCFI